MHARVSFSITPKLHESPLFREIDFVKKTGKFYQPCLFVLLKKFELAFSCVKFDWFFCCYRFFHSCFGLTVLELTNHSRDTFPSIYYYIGKSVRYNDEMLRTFKPLLKQIVYAVCIFALACVYMLSKRMVRFTQNLYCFA